MSTTVTVVVTHQVKPGTVASAAARISGNGDRMAVMDGFIDRQLFTPTDGSEVLVTISRWASLVAYEAWVDHNRANNPHAGKESPYLSPPATVVLQPYAGEG